jgi:hypothetical protein
MRASAFLFLPAVLATAACSAAVSSSPSGDAEPRLTTTSAVVVVQRMVDPAGGLRAEASARFVRVAAPTSTDEALRAIGATLDLPTAGHCVAFASLSGGAAIGDPAPVVELVDVGSVSLEVAGSETRLGARLLPDVTDVVSGVVYARAADPTLLPPGARYAVHVRGGSDLAPFDVFASAPADPDDVNIAGVDASGVLRIAGQSVQASWPRGAGGDIVYVDVQPGAVRCVLAGGVRAGDSFVRSSLLASLFGDSGTLTVHRLHTEPLVAQGIEGGELRFDFGRSFAYARN